MGYVRALDEPGGFEVAGGPGLHRDGGGWGGG